MRPIAITAPSYSLTPTVKPYRCSTSPINLYMPCLPLYLQFSSCPFSLAVPSVGTINIKLKQRLPLNTMCYSISHWPHTCRQCHKIISCCSYSGLGPWVWPQTQWVWACLCHTWHLSETEVKHFETKSSSLIGANLLVHR